MKLIKSIVALSLILCVVAACDPAQTEDDNTPINDDQNGGGQEVSGEGTGLKNMAFGSCNRQNRDQPMWQEILKNDPQLWVWLGDNIYGDTDDMSVMKAKYDEQLANADYKNFIAKVPITGIWDDHDYGKNDAGSEYPHKAASQLLMMDFLGEAADSPRRQREGTYGTRVYGEGKEKVKLLMLDTRYFRDPIERVDRIYQPNEEGDVLGEAQWQWLESELTDSDAAVHVIASSIQIIPKDHPYEKWANLPMARKKLFDLIAGTKAKGVILLSGDRHIAEISKIDHDGVDYPIYEVTASGLTHSSGSGREEYNEHRVGKLVGDLNFGLMTFDWSAESVDVGLFIKGLGNEVLESQTVTFN
ncbi:MAG: alkaline phosphatase D family protein [Bacteroidota bacterium]